MDSAWCAHDDYIHRFPVHGVPTAVTLIGVRCMGHLGGYRPDVVSNCLEYGWQVAPMCDLLGLKNCSSKEGRRSSLTEKDTVAY